MIFGLVDPFADGLHFLFLLFVDVTCILDDALSCLTL